MPRDRPEIPVTTVPIQTSVAQYDGSVDPEAVVSYQVTYEDGAVLNLRDADLDTNNLVLGANPTIRQALAALAATSDAIAQALGAQVNPPATRGR